MPRNTDRYVIGVDETAGLARRKRASPAQQYIIGIDEAGRGPLAGPVVVGAFKISTKRKAQNAKLLSGIKDSKKLSAKKREEWFSFLISHPGVEWSVARVWPKVIDRINISRAANLGALRVYRKLAIGQNLCDSKSLDQLLSPALLDGGLALPVEIPHQAVIKGDEKIPVIAAASIIAKVTRDRIMLRLHKKYPQYRFDLHKGYGTKLHVEKMRQFGRCQIHRQSFAPHLFWTKDSDAMHQSRKGAGFA